MSGIYGFVRYDGPPVSRDTLAPIAAAMAFWGPDGHGQWCGESAGLGHLMLHVTPESLHERLPASIRVAPHLVITADARIDNRDELFDALGVPGSGRAQTPDSSLILLAYERWGEDCVSRLLGDFAFAIWDGRERKLFCARDIFGCKPFVYHHDGARFIFASDVKGVLARIESPRLNEPLVAAYLQMKTYHAEKRLTFFEEIVKLPPAHTLTLTAGGVQLSRYWRPEDAPEIRFAADADYTEQLRSLFQTSVECRLRSAYPIGSHLSGGLDSSAITIVAARSLRDRKQELEAFSWSPKPESGVIPESESEHLRIDAVCRQEELPCHYVPPSRTRLLESCQRDIATEPDAMLAREADLQQLAMSQGLRVMLSGWGGDQAVTAHTNSYLAEFLASGNWSELQRAIGFRLAASSGKAQLQRVAGVVRDMIIPGLPDVLYAMIRRNAYQKHKSPCVQKEFARRHRRAVAEIWGPTWRQLPGVRATICRHLENGAITRRAEHWAVSGGRNHLEYRYPMIDRRLIEFMLGVPTRQFCGPDLGRSLFRSAVAPLLPVLDEWRWVKREPSMVGVANQDYFTIHAEWARHLRLQATDSPANRFVDIEKIRRAIQSCRGSSNMALLGGIREAFQICAVSHLH